MTLLPRNSQRRSRIPLPFLPFATPKEHVSTRALAPLRPFASAFLFYAHILPIEVTAAHHSSISTHSYTMQAPPPVNVNGKTPSAADGKIDEGPTQEEVHSKIEAIKLEEKGNVAGSTSRRLAETAGSLGGHTFKKTVGAVNGHHERYILPSDVPEEDFLGFIDAIKAIVGDEHVAVNYDPDHQAEADYENQPKFYVSTDRMLASATTLIPYTNRTSLPFNLERTIWHPQSSNRTVSKRYLRS